MKRILFPLIVIMITAMAGFTGFMLFSLLASPPVGTAAPDRPAHDAEQTAEPEYIPVFREVIHSGDGIERISSGTVITFEYYNPATSGFETVEEHASQILIGKTRAELATMFADWRVISFTPYHVRLQQNSTTAHQQFIISAHQGFIAVFYADDAQTLKELTARPIAALPESEQTRLESGIRVTGNIELMQALEDFGS